MFRKKSTEQDIRQEPQDQQLATSNHFFWGKRPPTFLILQNLANRCISLNETESKSKLLKKSKRVSTTKVQWLLLSIILQCLNYFCIAIKKVLQQNYHNHTKSLHNTLIFSKNFRGNFVTNVNFMNRSIFICLVVDKAYVW